MLICHTHAHFYTWTNALYTWIHKVFNHDILTLFIILRLISFTIIRATFDIQLIPRFKPFLRVFIISALSFWIFQKLQPSTIHHWSSIANLWNHWSRIITLPIIKSLWWDFLDLNDIDLATHNLIFVSFYLLFVNNVQLIKILDHFDNVELRSNLLFSFMVDL